jgi:hypothetical protein
MASPRGTRFAFEAQMDVQSVVCLLCGDGAWIKNRSRSHPSSLFVFVLIRGL